MLETYNFPLTMIFWEEEKLAKLVEFNVVCVLGPKCCL